ncbi:hydrogenase maturation protease [Acidiferrobacter sp.]|uniref:hydrogenase maturation protease n=1 Tax=Acidiferrobacter sp. TaxID=1872107 RepID=UPI002627F009|nr:hydrogenase maturation protease [Acidiferrobacter sp.]
MDGVAYGNGEANPGTRSFIVLGLGNVLQQDDGVGVHALRWLKEDPSIAQIAEFVDGGTVSFILLETIQTSASLIVVDAVALDGVPGDVRVFEGDDMDRILRRTQAGSVHEVSLSEVLDMARLCGSLPPRRALIGVQPQSITWGSALSGPVHAAVPRVVAAVHEVLRGWNDALI